MVHIITIAILGGIYVILGGLRAVMITDTIQGILLFVAAGVIFVFLFQDFDWDWMAFPEIAGDEDFSIARSADDDFLPWPGIFTGAIWLGFYVWVSNHMVVQRVLAAKNIDHGRWGVLFVSLMQLPLLILLIFPGILARDVFPDLDDPDMAWPSLVFEYLPQGLRGLVVAALIAALMSTLDSVLNGASSLVVNDFIKTRKKQYTEKQLLLISRVLVGVFMVIAVLWAPVILTFDTIVEYFQSFLGYVTMPFVVVLLGGIFFKRATMRAAFWTLTIIAPLGMVGFITGELLDLHGVHFLYATGIMFLISAVMFAVITLSQEAPTRRTSGRSSSAARSGTAKPRSRPRSPGTSGTAMPPSAWSGSPWPSSFHSSEALKPPISVTFVPFGRHAPLRPVRRSTLSPRRGPGPPEERDEGSAWDCWNGIGASSSASP
ncbi:hypothetical protein [Nesterenkonia pannonica]|uniref:sodium:solute symporter family transporter n=1 Tax=Nesterenkonia pannonica TaxID=1548602 RepID=UPI002164830D|nr:hypothetical protein [Nesterenkonia pannonica]